MAKNTRRANLVFGLFREGTAIANLAEELNKSKKVVPFRRLEKVAGDVDVRVRLTRLRRALKRTRKGTVEITDDGARLLTKRAA